MSRRLWRQGICSRLVTQRGAGSIIMEYSRSGSDNTEFDYAAMKYREAVGEKHKAVDAALDYVAHYDAEQIGVVIEP